ncbi:hypothetical protein [Actinomadura sp. B10D3]|uniref:hypothetical protein n=1 Tax=Actinomadura sp. B10D3 TaxID=3153557 RepID=UPI00325F20CF
MRPSIIRAATLTAAAFALTLSVSACSGGGGDVDKAALVSKLKSEPDLQGLPAGVVDKMANCMADVALKYGDKGDLEGYVDGKVKIDDVKGTSDKEAEAEAEKCAKAATE